MTANPQNNCQNCDGVGSVVEYIEGEQGVCVTTCPSCDGTGAVAKPLDDEDKTPKPPTAADIPDVIWEIAERAFHESALVADDSKCVEIYARALLAVHPSIPDGGVREALATDIVWRISNVHDLRDPAVRDPIERAVRNALATLSLPAGGVAVSDAVRDAEIRAETAEAIVCSAREVLTKIEAHAPDVGVDEFLDALHNARLLIAKIDGAE